MLCLFLLWIVYKDYNNLVNELYEKEPKDSKKKKVDGINKNIKVDINRYFERDEFAFMLDKLIKEFFEANKKKLTNSELLGTIQSYNPYFSVEEGDKDKYKNKRDVYIFDYVNFKKITESFTNTFRLLNFEQIFEENITDYINKITGKIEDIQTFGNIIKLINESKIKKEKQKDYYRILEEKYKLVVKNKIKSINDDKELENAIKIIAEFVSKVFLFNQNNKFLEKHINTLDNKIKSLIYIELITSYNEDKYKEQKNKIYDIYLDKIDTKEGREDIIKLVQKLKDDDRKYFIYEKLLEKCQFEKVDFFSNQQNNKIQILCLLNEELNNINEISKKDEEKEEKSQQEKDENNKDNKLNILEQQEQGKRHAENLVIVLESIIKDLNLGKIAKKDFENIKCKDKCG